jgi:hypothetical protein
MKKYKVEYFTNIDGKTLKKEETFYTYKSAYKIYKLRRDFYDNVYLYKYNFRKFTWDFLEGRIV